MDKLKSQIAFLLLGFCGTFLLISTVDISRWGSVVLLRGVLWLCCEISFAVSFLLCLLFLPPFVVVGIYLFFLLFLWMSFFSFLARG